MERTVIRNEPMHQAWIKSAEIGAVIFVGLSLEKASGAALSRTELVAGQMEPETALQSIAYWRIRSAPGASVRPSLIGRHEEGIEDAAVIHIPFQSSSVEPTFAQFRNNVIRAARAALCDLAQIKIHVVFFDGNRRSEYRII